ncbi:MAG: hypothetical protein ACOCUW_03110 [Gemmatimonadota bacterium]
MTVRAALFTLILVTPLASCEDAPWRSAPPPAEEAVTPDFGPVAAYNRRLFFLGPGTDLPTAAVFDFTMLADSTGSRRGARVRLVDGEWQTLVDEGWAMEPMREPWRLIPHDGLTMVLTETGDLAALVHRDSVATRLEVEDALMEYSPDIGTRLVLRQARLLHGDRVLAGVLLDAQLGRTVPPELVARDTAAEPADPVPPTPIARPGAEALLVGNEGYYAVLTTASGGQLGWVSHAGDDNVRADVRITPAAWSAGADSIPTGWRVVSADGQFVGELTTTSSDRVALDGAGEVGALAYALVTGWVEDRAVRRDVVGLVRHVW